MIPNMALTVIIINVTRFLTFSTPCVRNQKTHLQVVATFAVSEKHFVKKQDIPWVAALAKCAYRARHSAWRLAYSPLEEVAWPSGQRFGLAIRPSRVRVQLYPHAGFARSSPV